MAYPSPTIYYYRIKQILPPGNTLVTAGNLGQFFLEFSSNGGASYQPVNTDLYGSVQSAKAAISVIVGAELQFQQQVYQGQIPSVNFIAYP